MKDLRLDVAIVGFDFTLFYFGCAGDLKARPAITWSPPEWLPLGRSHTHPSLRRASQTSWEHQTSQKGSGCCRD